MIRTHIVFGILEYVITLAATTNFRSLACFNQKKGTILTFIFIRNEKMKKQPQKYDNLSKLQTTKSAQKQQKYKIHLSFHSTWDI